MKSKTKKSNNKRKQTSQLEGKKSTSNSTQNSKSKSDGNVEPYKKSKTEKVLAVKSCSQEKGKGISAKKTPSHQPTVEIDSKETKMDIKQSTPSAASNIETEGINNKRKKHHKQKKKSDGMSNWKSLCANTLHITPTRKKPAVKRTHETDESIPASEPKKAKSEVWFDNVDEIFLEQPACQELPSEADQKKSSQQSGKDPAPKTKDVTDKLVKPDSFSGLTSCVAMDCEMVGTGASGEESVLARVSIVNHYGVCLYDKYVLPREEVTDYRTFVSGITEENLSGGEEFTKVQKEVSDILKGRVLVGHALHNDLKVLFLTHPHSDIRDTSKYKPFRELFNGRIPSLKKLTDKLLSVTVQEGQHSSVQDAQATMRLYTMFRQRWEKELRAKMNTAKRKKVKKKTKKNLKSNNKSSIS